MSLLKEKVWEHRWLQHHMVHIITEVLMKSAHIGWCNQYCLGVLKKAYSGGDIEWREVRKTHLAFQTERKDIC